MIRVRVPRPEPPGVLRLRGGPLWSPRDQDTEGRTLCQLGPLREGGSVVFFFGSFSRPSSPFLPGGPLVGCRTLPSEEGGEAAPFLEKALTRQPKLAPSP